MDLAFIIFTSVFLIAIPFLYLLLILIFVLCNKSYPISFIKEPLLVTLIITGTILLYAFLKLNSFFMLDTLYWFLFSLVSFVLINSIFIFVHFKHKDKKPTFRSNNERL